MGAQWTNKYAILRDLSFAQGRKVPAKLVGSIGDGDKPPAINIVEETEEEFFKNYVGDGELHTKPDLSMIKQLLDEVHASEVDVDDLNDGDTEKVLQITKLNPLSTEFLPKNSEADDIIKEVIGENNKVKCAPEIQAEKKAILPKKKRRERNAAILSLLELECAQNCSQAQDSSKVIDKSDEESKERDLEVKLLKPNDFISDKTVTKAVDKVTEWLDKPAKCQSPKGEPISLPATSIPKRKKQLTPVLETTSMFKRKTDTSSTKSFDSDTARTHANDAMVQSCNIESNNMFVPSAHANEYYKKFVERSKMQDLITEDLWERAQREMKELDAKKLKAKQERMALHQLQVTTDEQSNIDLEGATPQNETTPTLLADVRGLDLVRLPLHRHELPQECVVCLVLCKPAQTS
ncbi:uncharacterized protein [Epargyreus clarus]|uniref:uncharacterized protein n=1 Tax=Epargyreus clarus TaxID=520877 RepID=UPI003C2AB794